jgi:hypothetical protein
VIERTPNVPLGGNVVHAAKTSHSALARMANRTTG